MMSRWMTSIASLSVVLLSACATVPPTSPGSFAPTDPVPSASPADSPSMTGTPSAGPVPSPSTERTVDASKTVRVDDLVVSVLATETRDLVTGRMDREQKGHWLAVTVRATNEGPDGVTLHGSSFQLNEAGGKTYQTDDPAMFVADETNELLGEEIGSQSSAEGTLLFAVPKNTDKLTLVVWKPTSTADPGSIPLNS